MVERVFLGWDEPFLMPSVNWLIERRDELPGMLVVVPTAQSGRRLRETLAEVAGAVLAPRVTTPGNLLAPDEQGVAPNWMERLAWAEILEGVQDWSHYQDLFPQRPGDGSGWAAGLANELADLRKFLQENGLTLATAAWAIRESVEKERWSAMARLEKLLEAKLAEWKIKSRSRALTEGIQLPAVGHIVLAGVAEMPPLLARTLASWEGKVTVLIGAPESEAESFSLLGEPLEEVWSNRNLPWPDKSNGSVVIAVDPGQQAQEAIKAIAAGGLSSDRIALGSADTDVGKELERALNRGGWTAFHPAAPRISTGLVRWFKIWSAWLKDPTLASMADLLSLPETGVLVGGKRAQKAKRLSEMRDRWMVMRTDELERRISTAVFRKDWEGDASNEVLEAAKKLEVIRATLLGGNFAANLMRLLEILARTGPTTAESAVVMMEWLSAAKPMIETVDRSPGYWIDLMLSEFPSPTPQPPPGRAIDIQGWLELFHEPGTHLVLCGMNEGKVPAKSGGEPWLSETIRGSIGLIKESRRAARDAFLYTAMLEARRQGGRVDVICGKSGAGGESLLPSRLLLAAGPDELPGRVSHLFREIEPPEAGLRWEADWKWKPRKVEPPQHLRVTALRDYLKCPFRYYLKHVIRMQQPDPGRMEWNARDFGNVAHEILERWGRDPEARDFSKTEAIEEYFSTELDRMIADWFAKRVPLAIRIQREALRQRLAWLARAQACLRAEGWEVMDVERDVELKIGTMKVGAKIDRIDRHTDGRLRVIDYKTGKVSGVAREHRVKVTASTTIPPHLGDNSPAVFDGIEKGKSVRFLWQNLQLPLYASALAETGDGLATPCYFTIGTTESEVSLHEWTDFSADDLFSATECATWIAEKISEGVFWPPAEKVNYDDYRILAAGRDLAEMVIPFD